MRWSFLAFLNANIPLIYEQNTTTISFAQFWQTVAIRAQYLQQTQPKCYALWTEDSYAFLSWLFAGAIANKRLVLPPHYTPQLQQDFKAQKIEFLTDTLPIVHGSRAITDLVMDWDAVLQNSQLLFFTSGSTGEAKQIPRTLHQLLLEVHVLQQHFHWPERYMMLASVSHQHIYGVLFKLLLPLQAGQAFYRFQLPFPEQIEAWLTESERLQLASVLIASPALLKRCVTVFSFQQCRQILSSGGKLDVGIRQHYPVPIVEVLGSSETGGIATKSSDEPVWQPLPDVGFQIDAQGALQIKTVHAFQQDWIATGDIAVAVDNGFELLGRSDRLVKLEEKRISLDSIEQVLNQLDGVQHSYVMLHKSQQYDKLVAVLVLDDAWRLHLRQHGKKSVVERIKQALAVKLEAVAIPKRWRFVQHIASNAQGKINKVAMQQLFEPLHYPIIIQQQLEQDHAELCLEFLPELECFKGHFPNFPIYPGVGQIGFLLKFSQQLWISLGFCTGYEQLKFQELIHPGDVLVLHLQRQQHKVQFSLEQTDGKRVASGRLLFQLKEVE